MRKFKDSAGRTWEIVINVGAIKRVLAVTKHNLCNLHDHGDGQLPLVLRLEQDVTILFDVLWELVKDQAAKLGVSFDQFCEAFDAGSLGDTAEAFWGELADFFRRWRPSVSRMIQEVRNPAPVSEPVENSPEASGSTSGTSPAPSA